MGQLLIQLLLKNRGFILITETGITGGDHFLQQLNVAGKALRREEKMLHIFMLRAFAPSRQPFFAA